MKLRVHLGDALYSDRTLCGRVVMPLSKMRLVASYDEATCYVCRSLTRTRAYANTADQHSGEADK